MSSKCPFDHTAPRPTGHVAQQRWWPSRLALEILHQNGPQLNPLEEDFDYAEAFSSLDLQAVKDDLEKLMTTSVDWWPADWGHYGPLFIRMAWHSAGTYRISDGRGGASSGSQRFAPLNSWPDNANLDKARRLLWPVKQRYGKNLSWADLMILAGNVALESMGLETFGFAGGREDIWEPEQDIDWGPESTWLGDERHRGDRELDNPLAAVEMGLIYVNPEGPNGKPDPVASGRDVRETFRRMAMTDEETVALVAGGHTFGKAHGAGPADAIGPEPEAASLKEQGLGWTNTHGTGRGADTTTSGIEGAWKPNPTKWDNGYFDVLFGYEWELVKSPAGAWQWTPKDVAPEHLVQDAHDPELFVPPMMTTADLSLRSDPVLEPIARRFHADPDAFAGAFARAWFKLTHRDLGPRSRYLGPEVPDEVLLWQDPVPAPVHPPLTDAQLDAVRARIVALDLPGGDLVTTAWAAASTFRGSDKRGGANGGRLRLSPQRDWDVNARTRPVVERLEQLQATLEADGLGISFADLVVLAGNTAVEQAARAGGQQVDVPFTPGRTDATQAMTDIEAFAVLEPKADGFRNHLGDGDPRAPEHQLIDRAQLLTLTAPELTALVGGLRVLDANHDASANGVLTSTPGVLDHQFFVHLLDLSLAWEKVEPNLYVASERATGERRWTGTRVDLVFGSNSQLRAFAEVFGSDDGNARFVQTFVAAWAKVMDLDRFDHPARTGARR